MFDDLARIGASGVSDYEIERSVRFNRDDSAYLTATLGDGNEDLWTMSVWVKKSINEEHQSIFSSGSDDVYTHLNFDNADKLKFRNWHNSDKGYLLTTRVFRDPTAWMHIVFIWDSGNSTAGDRQRLYINGVRETAFDSQTNPSSGQDSVINGNSLGGSDWGEGKHRIGRFSETTDYTGCYYADFHFIDGSAKSPSEFAETDSDTGQYKAIKYSGAYGSNGFHLKFSDNSGVTATTLGKDSSGNSNNFTPNNLSVSAGVGNDSLEDSPSNNFCTINRLAGRKNELVPTTNGNLYTPFDSGTYGTVTGTQSITSGKWYWEVTVTAVGSQVNIGICLATWNQTDIPLEAWRNYQNNGNKNTATLGTNTATSSWGATFTDGDVIGIAVDMSAGTITFYKNGTSQGAAFSDVTSGMPDSGWIPMAFGAACNLNWNFGQRPFAHSAPADHLKLCTANLSDPTIKPTDHFNTVLYTGNGGSSQTITGLDFSPDFVWFKERSGTQNHMVFDTVRGVEESLWPNDTWFEEAYSGEGVSAFNSNGVTIGNSGNLNVNSDTYVMWSWKESATAGFDIVSYTGTGSTPQTRAHSLGVAPEMMIVKSRSGTYGDEHWAVYHHRNQTTTASSAQYWARLNTTGAFGDLEMWNDTVPTSSVFTTQNHAISNANGDTFIAYLFASVKDFSKVGYFIGNGSNDGAYVHLGFRPAWVMWKATHGEGWHIRDDKRGVNDELPILFANNNNAEYTTGSYECDFLAKGFKLRTDAGGTNGNGHRHVYLAFASSPEKYALAR